MSNATLSFLPWARQGAASAITAVDFLGTKPQSGVADISAFLSVNGAAVTAPTVRLRGPADVVGLDPNQVVRTDPHPGATDFEPNCFPSIEFDRADFPWLFTPAQPNEDGKLRPWLCLIVVRKQEGVTLSDLAGSPLPALQIGLPAKPGVELPNLLDSWAWAHTQVASDYSLQPGGIEDREAERLEVDKALNGGPDHSLSRLVCPRLLSPDTDYIACVVPTFELGRKGGLGITILATEFNSLAPAWTSTPPAQVTLPVFYHWEFRTGQLGDFESLALRLTPRAPAGLGKRTIDLSQPGFTIASDKFPAGATVDLEGALQPIVAGANTSSPPPWTDPAAQPFQQALAPIINEPDRTKASPVTDPLLAPPIYGRWHVGSATVTPAGTRWLDQLNLDPRWRVAAAIGTRVVQDHQEALMTSAWEQAAELQHANQRMRQLQLSLSVGEHLHERHFSSLSEEMVLRIAAPAFGRLRQTTGQSLLAHQSHSFLPVGANRSAMRRIGRQRGPLTRRIAAQGFTRSATDTWVARLNNMGTGFPAPPTPPAVPAFAVMPSLPFAHLAADSFYGSFTVSPENTPVPSPGTPILVTGTTEVPGFFRAAAIEHLSRVFVPRSIPPSPHFIIFQNIRDLVIEQTRPRVALAALVRAAISTGDTVLAPTAPAIVPTGVETVMAAPSFTQPMYEPLRDLSQELLLPGLAVVPPDTVVGLRTNRRFVESYMVGLNHEMGRELLWRGYPTDQRGTYFKHFWGQGIPNSAPEDIADLNTWGTRALGGVAGAPVGEEFVMLMRSALLRRYPNAVIYLTPAVADATQRVVPSIDVRQERPPVFSGAMPPDVAFFGFTVTADVATGADGGLGYYVVIQEHPTEPRFGLDAGVTVAGASHVAIGTTAPAGVPPRPSLTWGKNAAHIAGLTRRLPVRMAIHASRLVVHA